MEEVNDIELVIQKTPSRKSTVTELTDEQLDITPVNLSLIPAEIGTSARVTNQHTPSAQNPVTINYESIVVEKAQLSVQELDKVQQLLKLPEILHLLNKPTNSPFRADKTKQFVPLEFITLEDQKQRKASDPPDKFMDSVLERQDRIGLMSKMETFHVESAARKILKQLIAGFEQQYADTVKRMSVLEQAMKESKNKMDASNLIQQRIEKQVNTLLDFEIRLKVIENEMSQTSSKMLRELEILKSQIDMSVQKVEAKIDSFQIMTKMIQNCQEDVKKGEKKVNDTRSEIYASQSEIKKVLLQDRYNLEQHQLKLDETIVSLNFRIEQYEKQFIHQEHYLANFQQDMNTQIEQFQNTLSKSVTNTDLQLNFKTFNELLFLKFQQVEDVKQCLRDIVVFQIYFFPLQVQRMIQENLENLEVAQEPAFIEHQRIALDQLIKEVQNMHKFSMNMEDSDYQQHVSDLKKSHLTQNAWLIEPLINPQNNLIESLINRYVSDLNSRNKFNARSNKNIASTIRRSIKLTTMHDFIQSEFEQSVLLKQRFVDKQERLKFQKQQQLIKQRTDYLIKNKFELKKKFAFKRQNSFNPRLDKFGQEDQFNGNSLLKRRSFQYVRDRQNRVIQDVTAKRMKGGRSRDKESHESWSQNDGGSEYQRREPAPDFNEDLVQDIQDEEVSVSDPQDKESESSSSYNVMEGHQQVDSNDVFDYNLKSQSTFGLNEIRSVISLTQVKSQSKNSEENIVDLNRSVQKKDHIMDEQEIVRLNSELQSNSVIEDQNIERQLSIKEINAVIEESRPLSINETNAVIEESRLLSISETNAVIQEARPLSIKEKNPVIEESRPISIKETNPMIEKSQRLSQKEDPLVVQEQLVVFKIEEKNYKQKAIKIETPVSPQNNISIIPKTQLGKQFPNPLLQTLEKEIKELKKQFVGLQSDMQQKLEIIKSNSDQISRLKSTRNQRNSSSSSISDSSLSAKNKKSSSSSEERKIIIEKQKPITRKNLQIKQTQKTTQQKQKKDINKAQTVRIQKPEEVIPPVQTAQTYIPMPHDEKKKLLQEFSQLLKPEILKISQNVSQQSCDILKSLIKNNLQESQNKSGKQISQLQSQLSKSEENLEKFRDEVKQYIQDIDQNMLSKITRSKSDYQIQFNRLLTETIEIKQQLESQFVANAAIASTIAMLIENINMQMEAEIADLVDRQQISLYAGQIQKGKKVEVIPTSLELKSSLGQSKKSVFQSAKQNNSPQLLPKIAERSGSDMKQNDLNNYNSMVNLENYGADLKEINKMPVTMNQSCLSCTRDGLDTSLTLKMFKVACLSYKTSQVIYRDHKLTRMALCELRRKLIDKLTQNLESANLFKTDAEYPRRYFDDLIIQQKELHLLTQHQLLKSSSIEPQSKLKELLSQKLPFGSIQGKILSTQSSIPALNEPNQFLAKEVIDSALGSVRKKRNSVQRVILATTMTPQSATYDTKMLQRIRVASPKLNSDLLIAENNDMEQSEYSILGAKQSRLSHRFRQGSQVSQTASRMLHNSSVPDIDLN